MATVINGYDGAAKIGASGSEVVINYLTEYEIKIDQDTKDTGPFIGNSAISTSRGGKKATGSIKGVMVSAMDTGQNALITAINTGADVRLVFEQGSPAIKTLTSATTVITNFTVGQKSDEGVNISFDFQTNGAYTYV